MKAVGLGRKYDTRKTKSVRILGATILVETNHGSCFMLLFLQACHFSGEHFHICKKCLGRLKACVKCVIF